jgi:hypothetical protein
MPLCVDNLVELASEYWKLANAFERSIAFAPDSHHSRMNAQARYAKGKLDMILERSGIKIAIFDGAEFEINLPVTAVNAEDVDANVACFVERTLEPTILVNNEVILTGKVFLVQKKD